VSSTSSAPGSSARPVPSTSSGAHSTWPPPGSPDALPHHTRAGCRTAGRPDPARFSESLGEYVLPYTAVRTADDPDAVLLDFLQRTYEAAADTAGWDRAALERRPVTS